MSQRIEWATGLGDWTIKPGEWVDGMGSRNVAAAIWSGDGDGVIIEFPSQADAVRQLRIIADQIEAATDDSTYAHCRFCGKRIVFVPDSMGEEPEAWVHVDELGAEVPQDCEAGGFAPISPAHIFTDQPDGYCARGCLTHQEDSGVPCIPDR